MNQQLLEQVLQSPQMPSLPAIALEVIDLVQQPDVELERIAATVQQDPALAAKILKTVNSGFYAPTQRIRTVSQALAALGLNSVKTLALGLCMVGNLQKSRGRGLDHVAYWKHGLYTAAAARRLAEHAGLDVEEAFLGGIMQDVGMLALAQFLGHRYHMVIGEAGAEHERVRDLEQQSLSLDHTQVGGALAEQWCLPPILAASIRYHHDPDQAPPEAARVVGAVAVGNRVAETMLLERGTARALERFYVAVDQRFGMSRADVEPLVRTVHEDADQMRRLFDLPTGSLGDVSGILSKANEALLSISLQNQQQQDHLQQQNRQLNEQAHTDALTGAFNRRRLDEFAREAFARARGEGASLSVLFLDTDHFKRVNDTHGHPTGDRVLTEVASLLKRMTPARGLVGRCGGEEFAVVLPGMSRYEAARLAERVRGQIESIPLESDRGQAIQVTASIGVASDDDRYFEHIGQIIKAADRGVYAAKSAGRNCVRVFTPSRSDVTAAAS